jgi:hypothetical protein
MHKWFYYRVYQYLYKRANLTSQFLSQNYYLGPRTRMRMTFRKIRMMADAETGPENNTT